MRHTTIRNQFKMWPALLTRLLRRRILLIIISLLLLLYLFLYIWKHNGSSTEETFQRTRPLIWRTLQEHVIADEASNFTNNLENEKCRNSIQGSLLLCDDRGFVCQRENLLTNGCCDVEIPETLYYTCESCNTTTNGCCNVYEYCVSCCLHPQKKPLLEEVLRAVSGRQAAVYAHVSDHFELCLVKCRTNSHSVEHENKYRDAKAKFCYGLTEAHESQLAVLENLN